MFSELTEDINTKIKNLIDKIISEPKEDKNKMLSEINKMICEIDEHFGKEPETMKRHQAAI